MGFSFRKFAAKPEITARYELTAVSEDPARPIVLIVRHAGDSNAALMNHAYKALNKGRSRGSHVTPELVQTRLADAADAFARHVVVAWENVLEDGKPAPCNPETVGRFLAALIHPMEGRSDVFLALRAFAENPDNFRDPVVDQVDLGKG